MQKNFRNPAFTRRQKRSRQGVSETIASNTQDQTPNTKSRLFIVVGPINGSRLGFEHQLVLLQIVQGPKLTQKARNQQMVNLRPFMPRRPVVDRSNNVLAIDRPVYTLYAHPKLFGKSNEKMAELLAPILNKDAAELVKTFQGKKSGIILAPALPEEIIDRITSLRLNGLELTQKYSRFYPPERFSCRCGGLCEY